MYQPTTPPEFLNNAIFAYRLELGHNIESIESFLCTADNPSWDDLIDDHTDGQFTEDVTEMVYGTIGSDSTEYLSGEEETGEGGYSLDPKLLLPDLYSASLFDVEEEQQPYVVPLQLLYHPTTAEYDRTTYFPLETESEADKFDTVGKEEEEEQEPTSPREQRQELDLEERLAA